MSMTVTGPDGQQVSIFARQGAGWVDTIVRADSREAFETAALARRIMVATEDGNMPARGVNIDHIGPVVLVPGEYDAEGNELTAPTFDSRHHVNMRICEPALSVMDRDHPGVPAWVITGIAWTLQGEAVPPNKQEVAKRLNGVELIDPDTIASPSRVWA